MPFAFVDMDLLDENIKQIRGRAGDKLIRIASKSVRSTAILRYILNADPQFQGIMAFTGPEAVWLAVQGFDDILIAYPTLHPAQVGAICEAVKIGKTIIVMLDSIAHVQHLNSIAAEHDAVLPVCLDLDMSSRFPGIHFGVFRSPVTNVDQALEVHAAIKSAGNLHLTALMGYEAQIAGLGDKMPGQGPKNHVIRRLKKRSAKQVAKRRKAVVEALRADGAPISIVNGGGTGSMETTHTEAVVTEITVGSGFFNSHLFDYYKDFQHLPAAGFAIEVVRRPKAGIYTCHGGGYVASGAVGKEKLPEPYLPAGAKFHPNEGAGEVQTPILYSGKEDLGLGAPVFLRHSKAGELCERFNSLLLIRGGNVVDEVKTYRGAGQCFL